MPDDGLPDDGLRNLTLVKGELLPQLLRELLQGSNLMAAVPLTLAVVERDPMATAGCFAGDLVRGLMEVPGSFWGPHPRLYERYVRALRASAAARRLLPRDQRMDFWSILDLDVIRNPPAGKGLPDPPRSA